MTTRETPNDPKTRGTMKPKARVASFAFAALSPSMATVMSKQEPTTTSRAALASVMQSGYPIYADKTTTNKPKTKPASPPPTVARRSFSSDAPERAGHAWAMNPQTAIAPAKKPDAVANGSRIEPNSI